MISAPEPEDEEARLKALEEYSILDTLPEQQFDDLTLIASEICSTPIALISLIDEYRQWFKSRVGLDALETPRELAFCSHAILQDGVFIVSDSDKDERFFDNPLVTDAPYVKFYAGAPLLTPSGHKIGTICVIDDHPRKLNKSQQETLQALSRQIVNLLELRVQNNKIQRAEQAKSLFLANMSHEIRTPMNAVISCTKLLKDMIREPDALGLLKMIQHSGESLLNLINDILDFSKIESGKIDLESRPFNLIYTVSELTSLISKRADENQINVQQEVSDSVPEWVSGDMHRFRQILLNLLGNAIKFARNAVKLTLDSKQQGEQHLITIMVEDDGIGISEQDQKYIFNSFEQADNSISGRFGGTGLGLAICHDLVKLMQGEIWVESQPERGARFFVRLAMTPVAKPNKLDSYNKPEMDAKRKAGVKILLAEDDAVNQIITKQVMKKLGYRIDIVNNGEEAVSACQHHPYDVVLMDVQMPVLDGIEATRKIRASAGKQPRIIALTANAFTEDKNRCIEAGMDYFLSKPINFDDLENAMVRFGDNTGSESP